MKFEITQPKTHTKLFIMKFAAIIFLGFLLIMASCSNDEQEVAQVLAFKLESFGSGLSDEYRFSDINIRVYANKADWMAETNTIYTGRFDDTGELFISDIPLEQDRDYYADIFSDDKVLNNLSVTTIGQREYDYIFNTVSEGALDKLTVLKPIPNIVGDWKFQSTSFVETSNTRFPVSVNITKDYNVTVTDTIASGSSRTRRLTTCRISSRRVNGNNTGEFTLVFGSTGLSSDECANSPNFIGLDSDGTLILNLLTSRINYTR